MERIQANVFVGESRRLGRAELPPVPRQRHRRRVARHGGALSRRGAHRRARSKASRIAAGRSSNRAPRPTSICCAMPSISWPRPSAPPPRGLRLSLLLRRRTVSTKAALKLLDDASAAIQHSRDLLQHAINYAEQGITVLDRDLRLLAWNQAFIDLYDMPPNLVRVGVGMEQHHSFQCRARILRPRQDRGTGRARGSTRSCTISSRCA